ncbi:MAG TPA: DUF1499 domain-containing protein [Armatimonadaceae bacterium]|nr:DUF1499 domain-containing protein [Armatimonadaceae bacterium]
MSGTSLPASACRTTGPGRLPRGGSRHIIRTVVLPALVGAAITGAVLNVPVAGWTTYDVTTGEHPGYPDLVTRRYDASVENATQFAAAAATRLPRWKVVETRPAAGTMRAEVRRALPVFTDDVTVTITRDGDAAAVRIRSRSRVGLGDLGENARHIRALQRAMDDKLPLASP